MLEEENCNNCDNIECHRWMQNRPACSDFFKFDNGDENCCPLSESDEEVS